MDFQKIGFGTWRLIDDDCEKCVREAIKSGYLLVDTASVYRNEDVIGKVLQEFDRSKLFITSKASPYQNRSEETVYKAGVESLNRLKIKQLDLYLLHWPGSTGVALSSPELRSIRASAWRGMVRLQQEGLVRHIGVSNYTVSHLRDLMADCPDLPKPFLNQVELHPYWPQEELRSFCAEHGIIVQGYASLGGGEKTLLSHNVIEEIANKHNTTTAGVLMHWSLSKGVGVLPRSKNVQRIKENLQAANGLCKDGKSKWTLTEEDIKRIDGLAKTDGTSKFCWDPETVS